MPEPFTVISAYGTAGNFDGEAVGFLAVTATGAGLAADTMEFVSDVVAHEIDTADAPDYERVTAIGSVDTVGDDQVLGPAPAEAPAFNLLGAPSVGGYWLFDPTTGVDATMAVIGFLPQTAAAGLALHTVNAPSGWVRWRKQPIDLEQRVTSLEDRTAPDAADGDPDQVWTTDGAAGSWQDLPASATASTVFTPVAGSDVGPAWAWPLPSSGAYDLTDSGTAQVHSAVLPAAGGTFKVALQASSTRTGFLFTDDGGGVLAPTTVGTFPPDVSGTEAFADGAVFDVWSEDGTEWFVSAGYPLTNFNFTTAVADRRSHMYVGGGHNGGGVADYIDQSRSGDDAGYYMAADNDALLTTGAPFPGTPPYTTTTAAMQALRNQASGTGEGITGFYHICRMPASLTKTISTPLGDITITPANYASPQPVAGDVCLVNGLTVDGIWQDSNIQGGEDVAVGNTITWRTMSTGMFTDFEDLTAPSTPADIGAAPLTTTVAALTPTTGTVDLDLATVNGEYRTHALSGNVTYTSSNRAVGKTVTVKVLCDGTPRTFTFPAWVFVGTEPTGIAAGKTGVLTVTWFGTADTDAVAAWSVEA